MCIYMYIYICVYIYMYIYICVYIYICIHIYIYTFIHIYIHIYIHACMRLGTRRNQLSTYPYVKTPTMNSSQGSVTHSIRCRHLWLKINYCRSEVEKQCRELPPIFRNVETVKHRKRQVVSTTLVTVRNYRFTGYQP